MKDLTNNDEVKIEEVSSLEVVNFHDRQMTDSQVEMARNFPRNLKSSIENAITIVTMDEETASTCVYAVPREGKVIVGASVHLAKILMQELGNFRAETKVVGNDGKHVTSVAVALDLEKNVAIKVEVKRSIMDRNTRMNEDMIVVVGNACNAIALRNAIFSVIPKAIIDRVFKMAKQTITGDVSNEVSLIAKRKQVVGNLTQQFKVTENEVLFAIGRTKVEQITADDLVALIGIRQAIKDGDTSVESAFKNKKTATITAMQEKIDNIEVVKK